VSAVNVGEVAAKLRDLGMPEDRVEVVLHGLQIDVRAHDLESAPASGFLRPATRRAGLSLGDRACLALAATLGPPAVTADRSWQSVAGAVGVQVRSIR
jgi:PIN domain nuclease of toxin-antitoxin system